MCLMVYSNLLGNRTFLLDIDDITCFFRMAHAHNAREVCIDGHTEVAYAGYRFLSWFSTSIIQTFKLKRGGIRRRKWASLIY